MMTFIIVIHVIACVVLIVLVLIQRGRGGGLVESFAGVESMFGTKTSAFLTRTTTIMSVVFFVTCLSLAVLSVKQSKSLMRSAKLPASVKAAVKTEDVKTETTKTEGVEAEPAKAETVKTEAAKADMPKAEVVKVEAVKAAAPIEKAKPEAGKAE
ncbi:MAG: preprotein translocase subunit SecG [Candidatus Omnitrophica bacterium]|nr:preprotein translocase subunit SecG [Candidatus Omnitrophota bacterium]MBU1923308.1 preprotein translocase subunit SecG [Candidatus Omnitrophota bacterium]